ncbi:protein unc-13 b [Echinococcus multilocularis]|uniref:Protein unc-13 b n=1 Tax=Echinococcus multilocularis TaxID=6211 RepID=A0A0S4MI07_ECHMU|nr:protein unc-13 b [Echinococcus multilocularis]
MTSSQHTDSEPCLKVGRKEHAVTDWKCAGNMGSVTKSRASSVTTAKMEEKERNSAEVSRQFNKSSVGDSAKVEIEEEDRGWEEEEDEYEGVVQCSTLDSMV